MCIVFILSGTPINPPHSLLKHYLSKSYATQQRICVSFAPLNYEILTVIFQVTLYFVMKNIEIKMFEMA